MMRRDECLEVLARHRTDEVVVAVYKAAQEWIFISPSELNYTFTGAMGQGSSHALGLALGRPDRRVVVLDGDGSLLMNLGSLVTIAHAAPKNLIHCLCENGTYETNGSIPIPRAGVLRNNRGIECLQNHPYYASDSRRCECQSYRCIPHLLHVAIKRANPFDNRPKDSWTHSKVRPRKRDNVS